jgi:hypothetical protein
MLLLKSFSPFKQRTMQKFKRVGLLLLMAMGISSISAQQQQPSEKSQIQKTVVKNEASPIDPKLTGIERELQTGTLHTNPAKISTPLVDTKLQGEWAFEPEPAPGRPGIIPVDPKREDESFTEHPKAISLQPTGVDASIDQNTGQKTDAPPIEVTNYRDMKGESKQEAPEAQPGIINYRNMQGERTQLPGEKPK